jgi:hypothetical protein
MKALTATITIATLGMLCAMPQRTASAPPAASRVIDRTLSCAVGARAGVRTVTVRGQTGVRDIEDRSKWKFLASATVSDEYAPFAGVNASNPVADLAPGVPASPGRLWIAAGGTCRAVARIPLATTGLVRVLASQLGDSYDCRPGARVLVRVRGAFRAPTSLKAKRYPHGVTQLVAAGTVRQGFLAVRSSAGKPLAYAEVLESGKTRLFTAPTCRED